MNDRGERYLLSVPSNTTIRDLEKTGEISWDDPADRKRPFQQVQKWKNNLSQKKWNKIEVRDAEKGPLVVEVAICKVQTKINRCNMKYNEYLVIVRTREGGGKFKYDYYFSNAPPETEPQEYARVACAAHQIEECIKRAKSEAGLADYEVRNWLGWHHHQVLSILATWFLVAETERGKKWTPAITLPQIQEGLAMVLYVNLSYQTIEQISRDKSRRLRRNEEARFYHHKSHNRLPTLRIHYQE